MPNKTSLKKNLIYQALYEVLLLITPLIVSPYVSRVLGAENIGIYSYTYTVSHYFVLVSAFGMKNYARREIAKKRDNQEELDKTFSSIFAIHLIVSFAVLVAYAIYCVSFCSGVMRFYSAIMGAFVLGSLVDISWVFFGLEQFKITVGRNTVIKIVSVVLIFLFVRDANDLWIYMTIYACSNFVGQAYLWVYARKMVHIHSVKKSDLFPHICPMFLLFLPSIAVSLYNYMDKIMLGIISTKSQLGFYENAEKITFMASSLIGSVGTVMLPRISNLVERGLKKTVEKYIDTSMQFVMALSFALMGGIAGVSNVFAPVFWGQEFEACTFMLFILAVTIPFKGFANVLRTQFMIPNNMDKGFTISVYVGAVVNLISNFIFIRIFAGTGAAIGTLIAEFSVCFYQSWYCRKELPIRKYIRETVPFALFSVFMGVVVYAIGSVMQKNVLTLIVQMFVGTIIYLGLSLIFVIKTQNALFVNLIDSVLKKLLGLQDLIKNAKGDS